MYLYRENFDSVIMYTKIKKKSFLMKKYE